MQKVVVPFVFLLLLFAVTACGQPQTPVKLGGNTSVNSNGSKAFSLPAANMPLIERVNFSVGNSFFRNPWVIAPASTTARDGLGPLFNTNGCQNCHQRDGRGHPPEFAGDIAVSMLVRLSIPSTGQPDEEAALREFGAVPEPTYGLQLQDFAIPGVRPEGQLSIDYKMNEQTLADGSTVSLRKPKLHINKLGYGPMADTVQMSARIATPMIGLGLLAAIPEHDILALADPDDRDGDGISGRANRVWNQQLQKTVLGRFGWKAGQPTLRQQNTTAFNGDMGLTTTLRSDTPCTAVQKNCLEAVDGGNPEVSDQILDQVTFYTHNLAVPIRRNTDDAQVQSGEKVFFNSGCQACHHNSFTTADDPAHPWLSQQMIAPFSDMLLHDMGKGLADQRNEFLARGREWRTAPLWGIGLTAAVVDKTYFLHDGRARNLLEAILWHGGEAQAAADAVSALPPAQRDALLAFLNSL